MDFTDLKSSRILITGGAGFIGSHLAETLIGMGAKVTIIDDLSTGKFENITHLLDNPNFRFAIDTITNDVVLDRLASDCDMIFHLAAAVGVMLIVENPVRTIETNIMGTDAVLRAALRYRARVLLASSSEVYGKGNRVPFKEDDDVILGPTSRSRWAYAASKMVDEFLALAYYREKGLPITIFRLFNTVGPRQTGRYGMVIPRLIEQSINNQLLTIYGDGNQSRCFLHVKDAVSGILELAKCRRAIGEVFNIGSTEEITINQLARMIVEIKNSLYAGNDLYSTSDVNFDEQWIKYVPYEEAYASGFEDMRRRIPDVSKIVEFTGWNIKYQIADILKDIMKNRVPK